MILEKKAKLSEAYRITIASTCLIALSGATIAYAQEPSATVKVSDVTDLKQVHQLVSNFQERLVDLGSDRKVTECDPLIYYYGPIRNTARRGSSFGGVCSLSK